MKITLSHQMKGITMIDLTDAALSKTARNLLITTVFATLLMLFPIKDSCAMDAEGLAMTGNIPVELVGK